MKKFMLLMCVLIGAFVSSVPAMAQEIGGVELPAGMGFETFAGIVAIVSFALTQGAKIIPFVEKNTFTKIASSIVIAVVISIVGWHFKWAAFLDGMALWQVLIQGAIAGLSACGFYDVLKNWGLVKK